MTKPSSNTSLPATPKHGQGNGGVEGSRRTRTPRMARLVSVVAASPKNKGRSNRSKAAAPPPILTPRSASGGMSDLLRDGSGELTTTPTPSTSGGTSSSKSRVHRLMHSARAVKLLRHKPGHKGRKGEDDLEDNTAAAGPAFLEGTTPARMTGTMAQQMHDGHESRYDEMDAKTRSLPSARDQNGAWQRTSSWVSTPVTQRSNPVADGHDGNGNRNGWRLSKLMGGATQRSGQDAQAAAVEVQQLQDSGQSERSNGEGEGAADGRRGGRRGRKGERAARRQDDGRSEKGRMLDAVWCDGPSLKDLRATRACGDRRYVRSRSVVNVTGRKAGVFGGGHRRRASMDLGKGKCKQEHEKKHNDEGLLGVGGVADQGRPMMDRDAESSMADMVRRKMGNDDASIASGQTDGTETASSMYSIQGFFDCLIDIENTGE